ncbi:uncharacterized protein LOC128242713 [Mya arenaria]|uniref:uncharacterized protein LOC128242713 n=1 Tax=Mya arenaria TaxID=6604 RepID=UPI0022E4D90A|nr:uncharacterized protein LOC128242713 [Mya arenaria]
MDICSLFKTSTVLLLFKGAGVHSTDICTIHEGTGPYTYCEAGSYCCEHNTQCCENSLSPLEAAAIVFGVLLGLCLCIFCALFLTKKKMLRPGQVVQPSNGDFAISMIGGPRPSYQNFNIANYTYTDGRPHAQGPRTSTPLPTAPVLPPPYSQMDPFRPPHFLQPPPQYQESPL